jgi:hypothetical protein
MLAKGGSNHQKEFLLRILAVWLAAFAASHHRFSARCNGSACRSVTPVLLTPYVALLHCAKCCSAAALLVLTICGNRHLKTRT